MLIFIVIIVFILFILALLAIVGNYFYTIALRPGKLAALMKSEDQQAAFHADSIEDKAKNWWDNMPVNVISITSNDGLLLHGYHIINENPTNRLVILVHGYYGEASEMAVYAKIYYEMGFDIFAPDNRGHGKSEGNAIGMGWLDRLDCLQWIEFLTVLKGGQIEILLHGHSMGGAIVSILSGEKILPNIKGIISDCAYDSVKNIFTYQIKKMFKLPAFPIIPVASLICKLRAGYFFGEADVTRQVACSKVPILYIHGSQDDFVPCKMVYNLYDATDPKLRKIWVVDGAKHIESIKKEPDKYADHIRFFVEQIFEKK